MKPRAIYAPVVAFFSIFIPFIAFAQTLSVGDLVVINQDLDFNEFRLLALSNISSGAVIKITDRGIDDGGSFVSSASNEGTLTWTLATSITAGETFQFTITPSGFGGIDGSVSILEVGDNVSRNAEASVVGWESFGFSVSGDQVIIYQGTDGSPTFISGFHNSGNVSAHINNGDWQNPANTSTGSTLSHLPAGLTNEVNALAFSKFDDAEFLLNQTTHQDNLAYNGPVTSTDKATWMTRIFDRTNWVGSQTVNQVGSISETAGNAGATMTVTLNQAPVISNLNGDSYNYTEGDGATTIDQGTALAVTDADSPDFNSGNLTVTITSGEDAAEDVLSLNTSGTISLAGATAGSNVSVSGIVVGTLGNNIAAGNDLVVNFNSSATAARVQTLTQAVTYENTDTSNPTTGARNVRFTVNDGDGDTSTNNDVTITVFGQNDAPTATGIPTDVTVTEDTASDVNLSAVSFVDVDGNSLTVTLSFSAGTATASSGGSVTVGGSGSGTLTLSGTAANINTFLDTVTNIKYTGASNVNGNNVATITVQANDSTVNPTLGTVNIDVTAVNDAPTVTGLPTDVTVTEDTASNVNLSAATFSDVDGDSLTVTLTASAGTFAASSGGGVTIGGSGTGVLALAGTASNINTYLDTASNIQYTGASNVNGNDAATMSVKANDGTVNPTLGTVNFDITAVNDSPTASGIPTDITVTEDTAGNLDLSAVTFSDIEGDSLTVTLSASQGTMTASSGGSVTVGGSGTGTLTLSGTAGNINIFLDTASNIQYTGVSNVNGNDAATVQIQANDGTVNPTLGTVNIDITAVNDAPTVSGLATDVTVTEDTASNLDLSSATFADVDGDSLTVTLTASAGTMTASSGGGVTVGGSGTGTLTLAGTVANINTFLDTTSNIQYTGASNVNGNNAATAQVNANDGTVNPTLGSVNIDITAVNDAPTLSGLPTDVTVTEDTASDLDLSSVTFTDVDGDSLTVTLAATAGTMTASSGGSVTVGGSGTGTLTLAGTASNINTFLDTAANIQYTGASNVNGNDAATLQVNANDGTVNPNLGTVNIDITAVNDAPTVANFHSDSYTYTEGDGQTVIDQGTQATLADIDSADFNGGALTVTISSGEDAAEDTLSISTAGTITLTGTTAGSNVSVSGIVVGTLQNNISAGNDFVVNLNTNATPSRVQTLVQGVTYENIDGDNPTTGVRTVALTVSDGDGGTTSIQNVSITVAAANDAPVITNLGGDSYTYTEATGASIIDQSTSAALSDVDSADFSGGSLVVTITAGEDAAEDTLSLSTSGAVTLAGTTTGSNVSVSGTVVGILGNNIVAGNDLTVNLNSNATPARVQTLLQALTYENVDATNPTPGARTVRITVSDGDGGTSSNQDVTITVIGTNNAPVVANLSGDSLIYTEGVGQAVLDQGTALSVTDVDSADFSGGNLTVTITSGEDGAEDTLSFITTGAVTLSGMTSGSNVSVSGTVIGTLGNNITAGEDLLVNFNSNATIARVQTLLQNISYEDIDIDNPTTGARNVRVSVNDGDGGTSSNADVAVTVQGVNDIPVIGSYHNDVGTFSEGSTALLIDAGTNGTVTDVDSANFDGGTLTVSITAGGDTSEDLLSVSSSGTVSLSGTTSGSNLLVGATVIGTIANDVSVGNAFTVNLNAMADASKIQAVLRALTYFNGDTTDPTAGARTVRITLSDGDGGTSADVEASVTVQAINDEPTFSATALSPTFTEGGSAVTLFSGASASTIEAGQTFSSLTLTVTNVADPINEVITLDGTILSLSNAQTGTTATNSLTYTVALSGTTATLTLSGGSLTASALQTLVNAVMYRINSGVPVVGGTRVVTVSSVKDSGGTANGGDDTVEPALSSTVTVAVLATPTPTPTPSATPTATPTPTSTPSPSPSPTPTEKKVSGRVVVDGVPQAGVLVYVQNLGVAVTNENGEFELAGAKEGETYTAFVQRTGVQFSNTQYDVTTGTNSDISGSTFEFNPVSCPESDVSSRLNAIGVRVSQLTELATRGKDRMPEKDRSKFESRIAKRLGIYVERSRTIPEVILDCDTIENSGCDTLSLIVRKTEVQSSVQRLKRLGANLNNQLLQAERRGRKRHNITKRKLIKAARRARRITGKLPKKTSDCVGG